MRTGSNFGIAGRGLEKIRAWLKGANVAPAKPTSVTDRPAFLELCAHAAHGSKTFTTFRRAPILVAMFEHVTEAQGADYLQVIRRDAPSLLGEKLQTYRANDDWGSPVTYEYPGVGPISPATLRYMKVLADLERLFGDLSGKRIVEIGGGYGGQARLILERWPVGSYTLVDLEPVLRLARRYLTKAGRYRQMIYLRSDRIVRDSYDICISNYAFSELTRDVQESYASSLIANSDRGYLTCNFITDVHGIESWSKDELGALHAGAHWIPEEPVTFDGNAILVWGDAPRDGHVPPGSGETDGVSNAATEG